VPTGAAGKGTSNAVKIRRVMVVTVLVGQGLLWGGIVRDFPALGIGRLWPLLALALISAYVQLPALLPLQQSLPDGAVRRPPYPSAAAPAERWDDVPAPRHAAEVPAARHAADVPAPRHAAEVLAAYCRRGRTAVASIGRDRQDPARGQS